MQSTADNAKKRRKALRQRLRRAKDFPHNTCPYSRHVEMMGDALIRHGKYAMFTEEPDHCGETLLAVVAALYEARNELAKLKRVAT